MVQSVEQQPVWPSQVWTDPMFIRAYEETVDQRRRWRASIQQALQSLLGVDGMPVDSSQIPSAAEIRALMVAYLPHETKLAEQIVRDREERL